ncbi:MAG TPA: PilZ domain-containing protein [Pyrinomonadaceae bacterium]|nr:PilZ domain-containing protein [Pyrinomonadaceae bacterium]
MPELIRSVVSRVRVFFKDRRQSPRLRAHLPFTVSIHREGDLKSSRKQPQTLKGYTRDVSERGLALLVPQVHLDGHHLAAGGRELVIELELYRGKSISMRVSPHRYERLDESESGCTYLIGARIVSIAEEDRLRYQTFITQNLKRARKASDGVPQLSRDEEKAPLELLKRKPAEDLR